MIIFSVVNCSLQDYHNEAELFVEMSERHSHFDYFKLNHHMIWGRRILMQLALYLTHATYEAFYMIMMMKTSSIQCMFHHHNHENVMMALMKTSSIYI